MDSKRSYSPNREHKPHYEKKYDNQRPYSPNREHKPHYEKSTITSVHIHQIENINHIMIHNVHIHQIENTNHLMKINIIMIVHTHILTIEDLPNLGIMLMPHKLPY